jgi:hypothetical protein
LRRIFPIKNDNIPSAAHKPLSYKRSRDACTNNQNVAAEGLIDRLA